MKDISFFSKIYIATSPVDFRKQSRSLAILVKEILECNPLETRVLFVFTNKRKDSIRFLYWDQTGFALWSKVLEKDKYKWPKYLGNTKATLSSRELKWLLQGIDLKRIKIHESVNFKEIF